MYKDGKPSTRGHEFTDDQIAKAYALAALDNDQISINDEMGLYFWGKYSRHYLNEANRSDVAAYPMSADDIKMLRSEID